MQGLHAAFAFGAVLSPLVVRLSQSLSDSGTSISSAFYAFSVITFICGVYFCFVTTPRNKKESQATMSTETKNSAAPSSQAKACCTRHFRIILTTGALLGTYVGAETGFGGYVLLYAKNQYGMTEAEGQYVNALFFGCLTMGRVIGIPLSRCTSNTIQLVSDLILSAVGCAILAVGF